MATLGGAPSGVIVAPSDAPTGQDKKGSAGRQSLVPFARASKPHIEQGSTRTGIVINAAAPGLFEFEVPSYGFLENIILTATASGGTGTAAVYYEDAPWSIFQNILITDVNGVPIWNMTGYHTYLAVKYGGYRLANVDNSALTTLYSAGTTAGNFKFILKIPMAFGRDCLGCLPNMDASAKYRVQITVASGVAAATGPVYTTAPTGYPTLNIQLEAEMRSQPPATDMFGNINSTVPPAVGTVQYWTAQSFPSLSGASTPQFSRVGNLIRNHILVFRDTSNGTRATAESSDMPPTIRFLWDAASRYMANLATLRAWFREMYSPVANYDPPAGVVLFPNTADPDYLILSEYGDQWMATVGATRLQLEFTPAGTTNLTVLTNDIVPASSQVYSAPGLDTLG